MGLGRYKTVPENEEGIYHCFVRCVRRAFLCGFDAVANQDFSHRKTWVVERMKFLAGIFAIDVCAFAVLANHYHTILRTRPDIAAAWSDREVASRWLQLCPRKSRSKKKPVPPLEDQINAILASPKRVDQLRKRLCSLSWFMGRLNEFIARAANAEDKAKGRFWESRFKCQALLDDVALIACMAYVDLNPIRAGLAETLEESNFTSIQERIRAWQKENMVLVPSQSSQNVPSCSEPCATTWLCPITSDSQRRGILDMPETQYFEIVDQSGRVMREDKPGSINPDLAPILSRIGAKPEAWIDAISNFGPKFRLAAGRNSSLKKFADKLGVHWLVGVIYANTVFL
jgi:REP element-mobilizing transposase RayT